MKRLRRIVLSVVFIVSFTLSGNCLSYGNSDGQELSQEQKNAIAMLNYITVLTDEINESKNSRVFLEEAYTNLINNIYPNAVDGRTLGHLNGLLDTMERYRMIAVKRERLQYIYEQSQAKAMENAMPDPFEMINDIELSNPLSIVKVVVYTVPDAYDSYTSYNSNIEQEYLEAGWGLEDEEAAELHESRKETFSYMVSMVNDYDLPGDLTLTEDSVDEFVKWKNNPNIISRIQFLESNRGTYSCYGGYWLLLADSYYQSGDYRKCLDSIAEYENMETRIFRRDYEYAKVLPLAIISARETQDIENYQDFASERARRILKNTDHDDWDLRFFAAQVFIDLFAYTKDDSYLQSAYSIVLDNVNYLVTEQQSLNTSFLKKVQEESKPKGISKEESKEIEAYNSMLKKNRITEMPPIYEPLLLNCDLLFALANELDISEDEKVKIDALLHQNNERLFLSGPVDRQYWFHAENSAAPLTALTYDYYGSALILPSEYLTTDTALTITVTDPGKTEPVVFTDWKVDKVQRGKEGDLATFETAYISKQAQKYNWVPNEDITIEIKPKDGMKMSYQAKLKTEGTKKEWYDYLKVWEGAESKNNWYDYFKVWENSVNFVGVS